jgi:hypothetical protein
MARISGTVSGLDPDTTYDFQIRVVDANGNVGDWSNTAQGTTLPEASRFIVVYTSYVENYNGEGQPGISLSTLVTTPNLPTYFTDAIIYNTNQYGGFDRNNVARGPAPNNEQTGVQYCFVDATEASGVGNPLVISASVTHTDLGPGYEGFVTGNVWAAVYDGSWSAAFEAIRTIPYEDPATEWDTFTGSYGIDAVHQLLLNRGYSLVAMTSKSAYSIDSTSVTKTVTWEYPSGTPTVT